ncbi:MAG: DUF3347 domain-containing protein [Chitinophagaceae bacterium]
MKKIYFIVVLLATSFTQHTFAQDSSNQAQVRQLLSLYYDIKDALVAGNPNTASLKAETFVKAANDIGSRPISGGNFKSLIEQAGMISQTKDLKKQREYFSNFSNSMVSLARAVKLSDKPIYQAYCPMKKASWLSSEKTIKNPYYGSSMLTCGEVTETL